ncbi:MAG: amino acid adenylation domain-containing protein, partial [Chloroflexi bacterium]|nr:amino acid adenylation domain-containing protein [Chloroflexota bacterium]
IVGSPTANRTQPELEKLIAFFINPVVLRSSFADNPTFGDYLKTVRKIAMGAFAHQELPFDRLVEELKLPRDLSYHPLFQVGFTLQGAPTLMKLPGLKAEAIEFSNGTSPFDLMSELWETEAGGIDGRFEYDTDLFDHTTIQRLMAHYQLLLKNLIENPDIPIGQIPLLTPSEYQQIVVEWNQTTITLPSVQLTHELIAQQAMQTPDAPALVFAEQQMSYAELNGRSNQLAHTLQANGIGPEEKVGIFLDRSFEMVIAVLAVFKAGGAYVPLDPAYPPDRIAYMVADSGMSMILTAELLLPNVLDYKTAVLCLDRDWDEQIGHHSDTNPISGAAIDNLAYIIYTSGSTGKPKGVMVSHDALVSHCITIKAHYDLTPQDTVLQFSSFSFDASLEQLLPSLMSGAKVVLRNLEVPSVSLFCQQMIDMKMTVVDLPTAYWHQLTQDWDAVVAWLAHEQLRLLIVGGEAMSAEHLQHWHEAGFSGVRLLNAYGPTETTITALICDLSSLSAASQLDRVPIGRPIRGRRVYILDKQLQPVPIGVSGEIHIAGIGLARGYLNRPELTAEKFIPNPFASESGSRLYKTGDLGRYLADGRIEFLGRVDNQVKIRGFRIELGEIEAVLQQQTAVQDAVVVARDNNETGLQLVAYVVGEDLAVADLQTALGQVLPAYMVPTAIVPLDAFPLTPNGKIDHKALPSPMETIVSNYVSPRNDVETVIANIWAETLKLPRVGIDDNFFELGGHSLLGTQLVTRLRQTLRIELPLRALFDAPTVAGIAEVVLQPPNSPARVEKVAQLLIKLSQLSEEEAAQLLNKKR